jgi:hypothetical protein
MVVNVFVDIALSLSSPSVPLPNAHPAGPELPTTLIMIHMVLAAFILFQCVVVFFYWLGRPWSRWLLLVGCIFYLYGLVDFPLHWHRSRPGAILAIGSAALALYLIWYLHTDRVRYWFAYSQAPSTTDK